MLQDKKLLSARINSSCTIRNKQSYPITFVTSNKRSCTSTTDLAIISALEKECPIYSKYIETKRLPNRGFTQLSTNNLQKKDHTDYFRFTQFKQKFFEEHQDKFRDYVENHQVYDRRYFKNFKKNDRIYFKHPAVKLPSQDLPQTDMPVYNKILSLKVNSNVNNEKKLKAEKLKKQQKIEDREEKEYIKQRKSEYLANEQIYFDILQGIGDKGCKEFKQSLALKNKYFYQNLANPDYEFVGQRDLAVSKYLYGEMLSEPDHPRRSQFYEEYDALKLSLQ